MVQCPSTAFLNPLDFSLVILNVIFCIYSSRLDDPFGQFVREHQERFAALTATIMGDPTVEVIGKQQQGQKSRENASGLTGTDPTLTTQSSLIASTKQGSVPNIVTSATSVLPTPALQQNVGVGENQTSAADLVASILNGKFDFSILSLSLIF